VTAEQAIFFDHEMTILLQQIIESSRQNRCQF